MSETRTLKVVVVGNARQAQNALRGLTGDVDRVGNRTSRTGMRFGATMMKMGKSAALGFGLATAAAGAFVYKVGAPYEQTLNRIGALNKLNDAQLAQVAKRLESGAGRYAKLGASVGDAAEGVVELNKAGLSLNKSMIAVNATMVLAKAGNLSVGDSANLVANTLNTFKLRAGQAGHVANSLANAANASSADVTDLREALAMSALAAHQAGLSIDQTNAYLAILHNNGMKGSDAGTSLKTMLLRLTSGADPVNKALKGIGVSVFDANGNMRDMNGVIKDFLPALDKLTDEKRAKALYKIFGSDSIRSANAIFGEGSKSIDKMMGSIKEAGTAQRFAEASTKGLSGTVLKLKSNFVSLGQVTYRALSPIANKALTPIANGVASLVPKIAPAVAGMQKMFSGMKGPGGGSEIGKTFKSLKTFGAALMPTLKELGAQFMGTLKPALSQIADLFNTTLLPAVQDFLPVITPVVKFLLKIVGGALIGVFKGAVDVIKGAMKIIAGIMNVITGLLTGNWSKAWEGVKQILSGALQAIWGAIQIWWNGGILSIFRKIPLALKSLWKDAWEGLLSLGRKGMGSLKTLMLKVIEFVTYPYRKAFQIARDYVTTGWQYIRGNFSKGVGGVRGILMRAIEVWTYPYRQAFALAKRLVSGGMEAISGFVSRGIGRVTAIFGGLKGKVLGALGDVSGWLKGIGGDIIAGLKRGIENSAHYVTDAVSAIVNKIPKKIRKMLGIASPSKVMKEIARWIPIGLAEGMKNATSVKQMQKVLDGLANRVINLFKSGKIKAGQKNALLKVLDKHEKQVMAVVKRRNALQRRLEKAQRELNRRAAILANLQDQKANVRDSAASAVRDKGSLLGTLAQDDTERNTVGGILARFSKRLAAIQAFRANFNTLKAAGLSAGLLSQIAGAGVDDGALMAAALVNASGSDLAQFNGIGASIDREAVGLGNDAGSVYDSQIKAAQAGVNAQTTVVANVNVVVQGSIKAEKDLAKSIAAAVRDEITRMDKRAGSKK